MEIQSNYTANVTSHLIKHLAEPEDVSEDYIFVPTNEII